MATTCVTKAAGVPAYPSQNASGTAEGTAPVTLARKNRMVQPITTL